MPGPCLIGWMVLPKGNKSLLKHGEFNFLWSVRVNNCLGTDGFRNANSSRLANHLEEISLRRNRDGWKLTDQLLEYGLFMFLTLNLHLFRTFSRTVEELKQFQFRRDWRGVASNRYPLLVRFCRSAFWSLSEGQRARHHCEMHAQQEATWGWLVHLLDKQWFHFDFLVDSASTHLSGRHLRWLPLPCHCRVGAGDFYALLLEKYIK